MSVHFWMGEGAYDNTHENEFAAEIAQYLDSYYRDHAEEAHVVFNLKLPRFDKKRYFDKNRCVDHDMVILTAKKLFDIEMKCHQGCISIDEKDGKWYCGEEIIKGGDGKGNQTPVGQVGWHRYNMSSFLEKHIGEFCKEKDSEFDCKKYVLGVLLFPNDADVSQPQAKMNLPWFRVVNLSSLEELLSTEASGRGTELSSEQMMTFLEKYLMAKPAKLGKNGMPYVIKESNVNESTRIKKASAQNNRGGDGLETKLSDTDKGKKDAKPENDKIVKDKTLNGVNSIGRGAESPASNADSNSDAEEHLNTNERKSQDEQENVAESKDKPKSPSVQRNDGASSIRHDSPATKPRKNYVDYPVTQVQVSPARVQVLGAFLRCFCSGWSPISLVGKLFRQKTGIDVKEFVGYDLDTLSRDPVGEKLLEWRRADKYPHKLEVSAIGGEISEPSSRTISCVQNLLKDVKPEDVDYVEVVKKRRLRMRPEMVMVAHVLKKED